jgi:hypothetical protein
MSRAYRIAVKESLVRTVRVTDGVCSALELLPILAPKSMAELLGAELERRGFRRQGSLAIREKDGVEITVDLSAGSVTARATAEKEVTAELERSANVENREAGTEMLRARVQNELEAVVETERTRLGEEVLAKLERKLVDLRAELDEVTSRVLAEALKVRAAEIGQIEQIVESPDGEVTIKVRL